MPPFPRARRGPPVGGPAGDQRRANPGADQRHDSVPGTAARAEPQFGLPHGLRAVLKSQRQIGASPQQPLERHRVPAIGLAVHQDFRSLLHDPRHPDTHPENGRSLHPAVGKNLAQPGQDPLRDDAHLAFPGIEPVAGLRPRLHRQVEQLHLDASLADINPDDVPVFGIHLQQDPRPPAVGVNRPGFDEDALVEQLSHHIADRSRAQPGHLAQLQPTQMGTKIERPQQRRPGLAPQAADRPSLPVPHDPPLVQAL